MSHKAIYAPIKNLLEKMCLPKQKTDFLPKLRIPGEGQSIRLIQEGEEEDDIRLYNSVQDIYYYNYKDRAINLSLEERCVTAVTKKCEVLRPHPKISHMSSRSSHIKKFFSLGHIFRASS